jgi:D-3-phosphoglycerate dehydrogenase
MRAGDHRSRVGKIDRSAVTPAWLPIVLFIDRGFEVGPFADALAGEFRCQDQVAPAEHEQVVALVTGSEPVGVAEVTPFPRLKVVLSCSTGTDHLDATALQALGLTVCHTPAYCSSEVADHALACVLSAWRGLWSLGAEVRAGRWEPGTLLRRFDAQRLGIVGLGRIGAKLAHRARALGIEVVGRDPYPGTGAAEVPRLDLEELLATSDAVSLHLPGVPGAPPLLGVEQIAMMKPGAVLVNLSRPSLVDLDAMLAALRAGALGGAVWDVWPQEPPDHDDARLRTPGLLVTPHVGWSSPQAQDAYRAEALDALRASLVRGETPAGLVPAAAD